MKCIRELCTDTFTFGVQAELAERCATAVAADAATSSQSFARSHDSTARQLKIAVTGVSVALGLAVFAGIAIFSWWLRRRRFTPPVPPIRSTQSFVHDNGDEVVTPFSTPHQFPIVFEDHLSPTTESGRRTHAPRYPPSNSTLNALSLRGRNGSALSSCSNSTNEGDAAYAEHADLKTDDDWAIPQQQAQAGPVSHSSALRQSASSWRVLVIQRLQGVRAHRRGTLAMPANHGDTHSEVETQSNTTSLGPPPAYDELSERSA
ncbi:hypothetical protein C8Q70DRAFT_1039029 [Cubamyces menziesii]|nr:hypothetical protein C8Q70DRAFT_1039029 [Cubamyces menziesii]